METFNSRNMINNPAVSKTRDDTIVDAVFSRYSEKFTSQTYLRIYHISVITGL